jgi:peptidoglycan lytic transglycosylase
LRRPLVPIPRPESERVCRLETPRTCCHSLSALITAVLLLTAISGCHRKHVAVQLPTGNSATGTLAEDERTGIASWYGDPYHGRRTSNGEIYNKYAMTAAHRTLPFDTVVKVNNLENGRNVSVRINDRGPFVKDRIIDLSYAAAKEIEMIGPGSAKVRLDVIHTQPNPYPLTVQVGAFKNKDNAEQLRKRLLEWFEPVLIRKYQSPEGDLYRVYAGEFATQDLASTALNELNKQGLDGWIVRLEH